MFLRISVLFLLLSLTAMGQGKPSKSAPKAKSGGDSAKFGALSDQFIKESLALSPVNASYAGYHVHKEKGHTRTLDAELDDVSPGAFAQQVDFYEMWQKRFAQQTPAASLGPQDRADLRLLDDQIALGLLELQTIQSYKHNPTGYVELIGNALFLPLTQEYAPQATRVSHVLQRMQQIPRFLEQAKSVLADSDPIFVTVAQEENEGNIDLVENFVKSQLPAGDAKLKRQYDEVAPKALAALKDFNTWLANDLGKRKTDRTWRLGKDWYAQKFKLVMETPVTPDEILASATQQMKDVRAEMLQLAEPLHKQWFADHGDHSDLQGRERENKIIGEVLQKISDEHAQRDHLIDAVKGDLEAIKQFIRDKKIVSLGPRDNLKVIPTPVFMRGTYSVAGFHSAPPLEPTAEAQYWVSPIDPKTPEAKAESKLREYNNYTLKWLTIHEALPGHYVQFEHANNVQPLRRRLLRNLYGNGCYVEGWAEYIAQVMMDAGFPSDDPLAQTKFRLMMRKIRLRVLSNAILDVKMQTMNMSDDEAMDLMLHDAFQTQAEADGKLTRAKLTSTQLPTYYVGLSDWLKLRADYQKAMGAKFDMMKYHDEVLDLGALPIDTVRQLVMPKGK